MNDGAVPDPIFDDPRLAVLYDRFDDDRSDLDVYAAIVDELNASTVLDVGCGTGTLACMLAQRAVEVTGLDPSAASLDVARNKPGADHVRWILAEAASAPPLGVDLAVMTGNVAQVFVSDLDWQRAINATRRAVRSGGWLVFETRDPARRAWERWTREDTSRTVEVPELGAVSTWTELVDVREPLVSFRHVFWFARNGSEITSDSTIRFRGRDEIAAALEDAGFHLHTVRDAPDRQGTELVVFAQAEEGATR